MYGYIRTSDTFPYFSHANICISVARERSSQPVQRVHWAVHAIDATLLRRSVGTIRHIVWVHGLGEWLSIGYGNKTDTNRYKRV